MLLDILFEVESVFVSRSDSEPREQGQQVQAVAASVVAVRERPGSAPLELPHLAPAARHRRRRRSEQHALAVALAVVHVAV